jgi:16S rRNA (guanine966-N2)-methyltransferase
MRIISGNCKGRKLVQIKGKRIRPTSDHIREAIFNILGPQVKDTEVFDMFSGTGAMGIEALSRGAKNVVFSDISSQSCDTVRQNIQRCHFEKKSTVICRDVASNPSPQEIQGQKFDLIFMDPPYNKGLIQTIIRDNRFMNLISDNTIILAEHSIEDQLDIEVPGLDIYKQKKYSRTLISLITKI